MDSTAPALASPAPNQIARVLALGLAIVPGFGVIFALAAAAFVLDEDRSFGVRLVVVAVLASLIAFALFLLPAIALTSATTEMETYTSPAMLAP